MNETTKTTTAATDDGGAFGRYHCSGSTAAADKGLELLAMPTAAARRLGVERLAAAHAAGDRLATCVLGMCALDGVGVKRDVQRGLALLEDASARGSVRATARLATHHLEHWIEERDEPGALGVEGEAGKVKGTGHTAEERRARLAAADRRARAIRAWELVRIPLSRGTVTASDPVLAAIADDVVQDGMVRDAADLLVCEDLAAAGSAHAAYLTGMAYVNHVAGVSSYEVGARLICRAMRLGHHDALMWVRFARREGKIA